VGTDEAELVGVFVSQFVVDIQLGSVELVSLVKISVGLLVPVTLAAADGCGEEGGENDCDTTTLIIGPAEQGLTVMVEGDGVRGFFEAARFFGGAGVIAAKVQDVIGQIFVSVNN
jgi:hypothetical protein